MEKPVLHHIAKMNQNEPNTIPISWQNRQTWKFYNQKTFEILSLEDENAFFVTLSMAERWEHSHHCHLWVAVEMQVCNMFNVTLERQRLLKNQNLLEFPSSSMFKAAVICWHEKTSWRKMSPRLVNLMPPWHAPGIRLCHNFVFMDKNRFAVSSFKATHVFGKQFEKAPLSIFEEIRKIWRSSWQGRVNQTEDGWYPLAVVLIGWFLDSSGGRQLQCAPIVLCLKVWIYSSFFTLSSCFTV